MLKGGGPLAVEGLLAMNYKHNKKSVPFARVLRKNMTKEERHLWYDFLKNYDIKFLKQKPIGNYIVDFYCSKANLVIELDGSQHYNKINIEKDTERTKHLEQYGITVLRIPNNMVNHNFEVVCEYIDNYIKNKNSL